MEKLLVVAGTDTHQVMVRLARCLAKSTGRVRITQQSRNTVKNFASHLIFPQFCNHHLTFGFLFIQHSLCSREKTSHAATMGISGPLMTNSRTGFLLCLTASNMGLQRKTHTSGSSCPIFLCQP